MRGTAHTIAALVAALSSGCGGAGSSKCAAPSDCSPSEDCVRGACVAWAVCPEHLAPTLDSIETEVLSTSCGTDGSGCHSAAGAVYSGGLDLETDPYSALLGPDGRGAPAENVAGSVHGLLRVAPGDPEQSLLAIKLSTRVGDDPRYGAGMPFPTPGSVCPAAFATIRAWIAGGAPR